MAAVRDNLMNRHESAQFHEVPVHRDIDAEIMRIIASFAVITIHCVSQSSTAGIVWNSVSHFSVPVFILISGYYMLNSVKNIREILCRCGWLFLKLFFWGIVQYWVDIVLGVNIWGGLKNFAAIAVSGQGHLWYLYALITLYLFTPALYVFCSTADRKVYRWMLGLSFFFGSLVTIALRTGRYTVLNDIVERMKVPYLLGFIFLYLMGDYLRRYPPINPKKYVIIGAIGITGTVIWTFLLPSDWASILSLSFFAPGNLLAGIGFFVGIKALCQRRPFRGAKQSILEKLASCTEGIYLTHMIVMHIVGILIPIRISGVIAWITIPLKALLVFVLCACLSWFLNRVPYIRKFI